MSRYASSGGGPLKASREFKEMVKALHDSGIEVRCMRLHVFLRLVYAIFLYVSFCTVL